MSLQRDITEIQNNLRNDAYPNKQAVSIEVVLPILPADTADESVYRLKQHLSFDEIKSGTR